MVKSNFKKKDTVSSLRKSLNDKDELLTASFNLLHKYRVRILKLNKRKNDKINLYLLFILFIFLVGFLANVLKLGLLVQWSWYLYFFFLGLLWSQIDFFRR